MKIVKRILVIILIAFMLLPSRGQLPYLLHDYRMNDIWNVGISVIPMQDGYMLTGVKGKDTNPWNAKDVFVMKLDHNGNVVFRKDYGKPGERWFQGFMGSTTRLNASTFFFFGNRNAADTCAMLVVFDIQGDTLLTKKYCDEENYFLGRSCDLGHDGKLALTGQMQTGELYNHDIRFMLTEPDGTILEDHVYALDHYQVPSDVQTVEGGYLISGYTDIRTDWTSGDPFLLKTDMQGNMLWFKQYGEEYSDDAAFVTESPDGNYVLCSAYAEEDLGFGYVNARAALIKTDTDGEVLWERKYDTINHSWDLQQVHCLPDGSIVSTGSKGTGPVSIEGVLFKFSPEGDSIWQRNYQMATWEENFYYLYDFDTTSDQGFVMVGEVWYNWDPVNGDGQSTWIVKVDSLGQSPLSAAIPHHYFVDDIETYPNPVNDYLTIDIPEFVYEQDMLLRIISINGQALISRKAQPGKERISVAGWQRGLYLVEVVRNKGEVYSKKIIVK